MGHSNSLKSLRSAILCVKKRVRMGILASCLPEDSASTFDGILDFPHRTSGSIGINTHYFFPFTVNLDPCNSYCRGTFLGLT